MALTYQFFRWNVPLSNIVQGDKGPPLNFLIGRLYENSVIKLINKASHIFVENKI
jgi:hypothetical protein